MKKVAIITGASRGIGKAAALRLSRENYNLVITNSRDVNAIREVAALCREAGCDYCHTFTGDLGDPDNVRRLFAEIAVAFGGADVLINNAGISVTGLIRDMTDEQWDRILASNLSSVFYCCRSAVPYMNKVKAGKIINISSVWGNVGASCEVAYSATKAGINGLTRALAKELAPSHIQVNAIAPGVIDTDMNAGLSAEDRRALEEEIPAGRYAAPEEIAEAIVKILEMPEYFTGQIVTVDGGWI